jgi:beta-fructofuranosidase
MTDDRFRPRFHFTAPKHWLNDPNGLCFHAGRWHLHYQHNPAAPRWGDIHWGHASSADLVHWRDEPIAFGPSTAHDATGCFSGCIVLADDGPALAYYTGHSAAGQVQCLATSTDLLSWTKQVEPIVQHPPEGVSPHDFRDPFVLRHGAWWYMVVGASLHGERGQALLYRSADGRQWQYRHPLFTAPEARFGAMWECPNLLQIAAPGLVQRWVLTVSNWPNLGALAFVGRFEDERFVPDSDCVLDPDGSAFAHLAMTAPDGRVLQWAWLGEQRDAQQVEAEAWAGALSVLRELRLDAQQRLCSRPVAELSALRLRPIELQAAAGAGEGTAASAAAGAVPAHGVRQRFSGRHLDIHARFDLHDRRDVGLTVLASPDGRERTRIVYRPEARRVVIDRSRSSIDTGTRLQNQHGELVLAPGEPLELRVLVDASVIEVFANERLCLCSRVYPALSASAQGELFADGAADVDVQVWEMGSIFVGARG